MCSGARDYACWNVATFDGPKAATLLATTLLSVVESLPDFDEGLRTAMQDETEAFFDYIVRQDRSVLEFVHADWAISLFPGDIGRFGVTLTGHQMAGAAGQRRGREAREVSYRSAWRCGASPQPRTTKSAPHRSS